MDKANKQEADAKRLVAHALTRLCHYMIRADIEWLYYHWRGIVHICFLFLCFIARLLLCICSWDVGQYLNPEPAACEAVYTRPPDTDGIGSCVELPRRIISLLCLQYFFIIGIHVIFNFYTIPQY
jgi:hypothetical protein